MEIQILMLLYIILIFTGNYDFDGKLASVQLDDYRCIASIAMICSTAIILTSLRFSDLKWNTICITVHFDLVNAMFEHVTAFSWDVLEL